MLLDQFAFAHLVVKTFEMGRSFVFVGIIEIEANGNSISIRVQQDVIII